MWSWKEMKKQILDNILGEAGPSKRFATIDKPLGNGRFLVKDEYGRKIEVDSSVAWDVGDGVTIDKGGRVVDKSSKLKVKKMYQV